MGYEVLILYKFKEKKNGEWTKKIQTTMHSEIQQGEKH